MLVLEVKQVERVDCVADVEAGQDGSRLAVEQTHPSCLRRPRPFRMWRSIRAGWKNTWAVLTWSRTVHILSDADETLSIKNMEKHQLEERVTNTETERDSVRFVPKKE